MAGKLNVKHSCSEFKAPPTIWTEIIKFRVKSRLQTSRPPKIVGQLELQADYIQQVDSTVLISVSLALVFSIQQDLNELQIVR